MNYNQHNIHYFFDKHHIYFDTRILKRVLQDGRLTHNVLNDYISQLPDISDQADDLYEIIFENKPEQTDDEPDLPSDTLQ
ncbi:MAG: hypothetical protein HYS16_00990 [Deltaproteobacteria bacterium]|nr:MAG: hypothetical protein HYS16_00990 [Deltaproteobacteria bacterium]